MGQKLSALKRNRGINKDAQCSMGLDEGYKRATSLQAFPISRNLETETTQKTLLMLPTELILDIAGYLRPSGYMSLSYSCRIIRDKMDVSITQVLGHDIPEGQIPGSGSTVELRNVRFLERLEMKCMLDHDRMARLKTHEYPMSSTPSLSELRIQGRTSLDKARPLDSACFLSTRLVWICPHRVFDYIEAKKEINNHHLCGSCSVSKDGATHFSFWPVTSVLPNSEPSSEEVKEALHAFSAFMCPHLRLNAACVASQYNPECRRLRHPLTHPLIRTDDSIPDCCCKTCTTGQRLTAICDFCDTLIHFRITAAFHGVETLYILVMREFAKRSERVWVSQVTHPADFEECETAWRATHAECWRRLGLGNPTLEQA